MKKVNYNILLAVTGGIAAYKIPYLCRLFLKSNNPVRVIMTKNATQFVKPLTFEALTRKKVYIEEFDENNNESYMSHIDLVDWADIIIIAPATANTIAKIASGVGDNLLTSLMLVAYEKTVFICPAMNTRMYLNPITKENINKLNNLGFNIIPPSKGELACSDEGVGRLKEPDEIFDYVNDYIQSSKEYKGIRFLVTAGPTREYIDPVRYITNRSSGKMGLSLANVIKRKGGTVSLVTGSIDCKDIHYDRIFNVETADEMLNLLKKEVKESDILIMAAAVADFKPKEISERKIKKGKSFLLELVENPDILKELSKEKDESQVFVGFAAESDDLIENAKKKIGEKNLDMIVLNDISRSDIGFDSNYNEVTLIYKNGRMKRVPKATKEKIAEEIISKAVEIYKSING